MRDYYYGKNKTQIEIRKSKTASDGDGRLGIRGRGSDVCFLT